MTGITVIDQTGLNKQYINDTFQDEGVHQEMTLALEENLAGEIESDTGDSEELASEVITEEFTASELLRNINETVAYLNGDKDTMDLAMRYEPVRLSLLETTDPATRDAINESVPPEVNIEIDPEESGLATARLFTSRFPPALVLFTLLALATVAALLYLTPSYKDTARHLGLGLLIASTVQLIFAVVLLIVGRRLTISTTGDVRMDPKILFDGVLAVAEGIGITMLAYSGVLLFFGLALLIFSHSEEVRDIVTGDAVAVTGNRTEGESGKQTTQTSATGELPKQHDENSDETTDMISGSD